MRLLLTACCLARLIMKRAWWTPWLILLTSMIASESSAQFSFQHHFGDAKLAGFNNDGRKEILAVEMGRFPGARPPRWFLWENVDGKGNFEEHVILDQKLLAMKPSSVM